MVLILDRQSRGPPGRYGDAELFYTLDHLSSGRSMGRKALSNYVGIGEGSMRSLLNVLEGFDMVTVTRMGVSITPVGRELLDALGARTVDMYIPLYVLGKFQQSIVVKDAAERVFNGIDQRNAGIRAGGDGCSTWTMKDGRIIMLPNWDMDEHEPSIALKIRHHTRMVDGDVLIIGGGDSKHVAMMAAADAALQLVRPAGRDRVRYGECTSSSSSS